MQAYATTESLPNIPYVCEMPHRWAPMWAIPRLVQLLQPFDNFGHFFHVQRPPDHDRVPACSGSYHGDNFRQTAPGNVSTRKFKLLRFVLPNAKLLPSPWFFVPPIALLLVALVPKRSNITDASSCTSSTPNCVVLLKGTATNFTRSVARASSLI